MIIYKVTNLLNNKIYIGQTINSLEWRIRKHKTDKKSPVGQAFRKHGENNFKIEIIATANNIDELNLLEEKYIKEFKSLVPNGYNRNSGGNSKIPTIETREKMSKSQVLARKKFPHPMKDKVGKLHHRSRPVVCNETGKTFESARQAEIALNIPRTHILDICKGRRNRRSYKGLTFRFVGDSVKSKVDLRGKWKKGLVKTSDGWKKAS